MLKKFNKMYKPKKMGIIVIAAGVGIVACVIVPIWGWLLLTGSGLIALGCYLINKCG